MEIFLFCCSAICREMWASCVNGCSSQQCSCEQSGCEGSNTAASHFTGSEDSGSVHSFNTYLPWAGVCVCECACEQAWIYLTCYSHHSDGCCAFVCVRESAMNVCLCHFFTFAWLWLFMCRLNSLFILHLEPCVCMSVCIWNCFSVWLWRINCGKMLGGCLCSYHNGRGSWGRKKKEWEREKDRTTQHLSKIHPSCLLFSS